MVGATGFEPATSCSRSRRSTGLSYAPPNRRMTASYDAPGRTRTSNLLIRSQMLYPIELRAPTSRALAEAAQSRKVCLRATARKHTCLDCLARWRSQEADLESRALARRSRSSRRVMHLG